MIGRWVLGTIWRGTFGGEGGGSNLVHGRDVAGLDVVLHVLDLLLELVNGHLGVLHRAHDGQLVDAVADWDQLGCK